MILDVIREYTATYGFAPSVRDIAVRVDLASTSAVHHHLRALAKAGRITYSATTARSVRIVGEVGRESAEDILFDVMMDRRVGELSAELGDRIGRYFTGRSRRAA